MFEFREIARTELRTVGPAVHFNCPIKVVDGGKLKACPACFPPFCLWHRKTLEECLKNGACSQSVSAPPLLSYTQVLDWMNLEELRREGLECSLDVERNGLDTNGANNLNSIYSSLNSNPYVIAMKYIELLGLDGHWDSEENMKKLPKEIVDALEKVEKVRKERRENASRRGSETREAAKGQKGERELI